MKNSREARKGTILPFVELVNMMLFGGVIATIIALYILILIKWRQSGILITEHILSNSQLDRDDVEDYQNISGSSNAISLFALMMQICCFVLIPLYAVMICIFTNCWQFDLPTDNNEDSKVKPIISCSLSEGKDSHPDQPLLSSWGKNRENFPSNTIGVSINGTGVNGKHSENTKHTINQENTEMLVTNCDTLHSDESFICFYAETAMREKFPHGSLDTDPVFLKGEHKPITVP